MMWNGGWNGGWMWFGGILMVIFWVAVIMLVVWLVRRMSGPGRGMSHSSDALSIATTLPSRPHWSPIAM